MLPESPVDHTIASYYYLGHGVDDDSHSTWKWGPLGDIFSSWFQGQPDLVSDVFTAKIVLSTGVFDSVHLFVWNGANFSVVATVLIEISWKKEKFTPQPSHLMCFVETMWVKYWVLPTKGHLQKKNFQNYTI